MGGDGNGCIGLLGVTSNNAPQTEQHLPFGLLLCLGNVTIICSM